MENLSKCCLSLLLLLSIGLTSCGSEYQMYKHEFSEAENKELARKLIGGRGWYYQGLPAEQLVFLEASKLDPEYADPYREYGVPFLKRGFAHEYFKWYELAVKYNAEDWIGYRAYLYLYFYRDYERAIKDCDRLDVITPDFVDYPQATSVDFMRGIAYMQLKEYDTSLKYFDKHIIKEKELTGLEYMESNVFLYKAIVLKNQGKLKAALATINTGISIDEITADLYYWRSIIYQELDQKKEAKADARKAKDYFLRGNFNSRNYVEEFYQTYLPDIEEWIVAIEAK